MTATAITFVAGVFVGAGLTPDGRFVIQLAGALVARAAVTAWRFAKRIFA